jgi:apyrase
VAPREFGALAERACSTSLADLAAAFPALGEELRPFFCLDLAYAHTLLTRGFKIPEDARIHLVKRVEYNGDLVEAAWPLGAAINALG